MEKAEKISIGIGLLSVGLLAYNTHLNRKQAQMSGSLGELAPPIDGQPVIQQEGTLATVTSFADTYLQKAYASFNMIKQNPEVQSTLKDLGVDVVVKDITLDRAKTLLSAYALFKIIQSLKSNALKVAVLGGSVYALNKNKDKIALAYNELMGDNQNIA
jgi:galactitol-specific phosphotransferase system IIB component